MTRTTVLLCVMVLCHIPVAAAREGGGQRCGFGNVVHPPGETGISDYESWRCSERWVWSHISQGKPANLSNYHPFSCDREKPDEWDQHVLLGGEFLRTILTRYQSTIPPHGVRILCARFDDNVDLSRLTLNRLLRIQKSLFTGRVSLHRLQSSSDLDFATSRFDENVRADFLDIKGDLNLRGIDAAKIEIDLQDASIGGHAQFQGAKIARLKAHSLKVGADLFLYQGGVYGRIELASAEIGRFMQLRGSTFKGRVVMTGAKIHGELHLASPGTDLPTWEKGSALILRNVHVRALQDREGAWPDTVDLVGFTYEYSGGLRSGKNTSLVDQDVDNLLSWLRRQENSEDFFSPQPYEQLAKFLRQYGRAAAANDILFWARYDEMWSGSTTLRTKIWLFIKGVLIGFGYEVWWAGVWLIVLVFCGQKRFASTPRGGGLSFWQKTFYSLDMALPVIDLNPKLHGTYSEEMPIRHGHYFYCHKIVSFVLFSFLAAGLSGFVK